MKAVISLILILNIFIVKGQDCSGDACGSVNRTGSYTNGIPITTFKNTNKRKIRIFVKTYFLGGGCSDASVYDLAYGESVDIGGGLCPIVANFIEPAVTPKPVDPPKTPSQPVVVKPAPPVLEDGNYRIKNMVTGKYLLVEIDSVVKNKTTLYCDSVNETNWEASKWKIKRSPRCLSDSAGVIHINNYNIRLKQSDFSIGRLYCSGKFDCGFYAMYPRQFNEKIKTPDYYDVTWEFVKKTGENVFQIKTLNHLFYIDYDKSLVGCREILGDSKTSYWILERCE